MIDAKKSYLTIGELVKKFKKYYPDLSSSKLRFLESRGLITPRRAENRYRVYFENDVRKINLILKMQKDYFLPLEVIKEKLAAVDFDKIEIDKEKKALKEIQSKLDDSDKDLKIKKFTVNEVSKKYKIPRSYIDELVEDEIIDIRREDGKEFIDGQDTEALRVIGEFIKYGIEARNLKLFENSTYRFSTFLQQIVYPIIMSSGKDSYKKASRTLYRLEENFLELFKILFKKANKKFLESHK
jgi:DNA-binding transcriptional MerR regulator